MDFIWVIDSPVQVEHLKSKMQTWIVSKDFQHPLSIYTGVFEMWTNANSLVIAVKYQDRNKMEIETKWMLAAHKIDLIIRIIDSTAATDVVHQMKPYQI